jgi:cobalt-zinc-cadmium efflux system protein
MGGGHHHHRRGSSAVRLLTQAFAVNVAVFLAELFGGWYTGSLALLADAMHVGVDLMGVGLGLFAAKMSMRPPDKKRTFGYQRVEVLAALGNGIGLWIATGVILREAWGRFVFPTPVAAPEMMGFATLGLAANLFVGYLLYPSSRDNINLRAVFLDAAFDALGALGVLVSGAVILRTGWFQADPVASVLICVGIVFSSFRLLRDSIHILLEGAPSHLDLEEIRSALGALPGVKEVHDLHLWSLTQGKETMSGHLVLEPGVSQAEALKAGTALLKSRFGLSHVTLQIET